MEYKKTYNFTKVKKIIIYILLFILAILLYAGLFLVPFSRINPKTTTISSSDVLSYWGSFITAIGTISLSIVAVWQNQLLNKKSKEFQVLLRNQEMKANEPRLKCTKVEYAPDSRVINPTILDTLNLYIVTISNISDNSASNIHIEDSYLFYAKDNKTVKLKPETESIHYLERYKNSKFAFLYTLSLPNDSELIFNIYYDDKYGGVHKQHVMAYPEDYIASEWSINNIDELDNENK